MPELTLDEMEELFEECERGECTVGSECCAACRPYATCHQDWDGYDLRETYYADQLYHMGVGWNLNE